MKSGIFRASAGLVALGLLATTAALATSKADLNSNARDTLNHFYALSPMNRALVGKASGVLIFSHVTKGGIGVAGEHGEGVLRLKGKTVSYYSVGSASVGLTLGLSEHSEIIMFMSPEALNKFMSSKDWSVGADTAIALVSTGAGGQYNTESLNKPILGFVFGEKGLIGDLSFEGTKITKIKTAT